MLLYCLIKYGYRTSPNIDLFKYQLFCSNPLLNIILFIVLSSFGLIVSAKLYSVPKKDD